MKYLNVIIVICGILNASSLYAEEKCLADPEEEYFNRTTPSVPTKPKNDLEECAFYQRAWQMFLYSVSPDPQKKGRIRLETFSTPADVFGKEAAPNFPKKEQGLMSFATRMLKSKNQEELAKEMKLFSIDDENDPGAGLTKQADSNLLIDQNGHALNYGVHMNDTFVKYLQDNGFIDLDKFNDPTKSNPAADPEFPSGSLELKSSWRIIDPSENKAEIAKSFFVTEANVPSLEKGDNGEPVFNPNKPIKQSLALVGLHVVGVIDGHPEFIWATFEHQHNTPSTIDGSWTFNNWPISDCNKSGKKLGGLKLDETKKTISPKTTVCREHDFRNDPDIASLNESIHDKIETKFPELAIWKNYDLMGAVWINNSNENFKKGKSIGIEDKDKNGNPIKIQVGEIPLANTTMETFQQSFSCFDCHQPFSTRINVSHIPSAYENMKKRNKELQLLFSIENSKLQKKQGVKLK